MEAISKLRRLMAVGGNASPFQHSHHCKLFPGRAVGNFFGLGVLKNNRELKISIPQNSLMRCKYIKVILA